MGRGTGEYERVRGMKNERGNRLSRLQMQFIIFLLEDGIPLHASNKLNSWELENHLIDVSRTDAAIAKRAERFMNNEDVQREYWHQLKEIQKHDVADATEVMKYFTDVMRGEVKDQFGLDASLSDRTQAAKELAKRTIDMENRMAGKPDAIVSVSIDWRRNK